MQVSGNAQQMRCRKPLHLRLCMASRTHQHMPLRKAQHKQIALQAEGIDALWQSHRGDGLGLPEVPVLQGLVPASSGQQPRIFDKPEVAHWLGVGCHRLHLAGLKIPQLHRIVATPW